MQGSDTTTTVGFFPFAAEQPERIAIIEPGSREATYAELREMKNGDSASSPLSNLVRVSLLRKNWPRS
jgi:hypothetical protein